MRNGKGQRHHGVWSVIMISLCILCIVLNAVAQDYSTLINSYLGLETYRVIYGEEGSETITYPAELKTQEEIQAYFSALCRDLEGEGLVLMRNENAVLPLAENARVSLFGVGTANINSSVQGIRSAHDTSMKAAFEQAGMTVNETLWRFYTEGEGSSSDYGPLKKLDPETNLQMYAIREVPWSKYDTSIRNSFADYGDAAVVLFARDSTEGSDTNASGTDGEGGNYLALSAEEKELLRQVTALRQDGTFSAVIVLLNCAQTLQLDFLYDETIRVDACLWIGNTGMNGMEAVADVLTGRITPSGRLSDTWVTNNFSSPAAAAWVMNQNSVFTSVYQQDGLDETQKYYGVYVEGIYTGYRYYETRYADVVTAREHVGAFDYAQEVAGTFGSGLSYAEFAYENFSVAEDAQGNMLNVSLRVTNVGDTYAGKEVVQIYLQKPYTDYDITHGIEVSAIELAGFAKTPVLAPGESADVSVQVEKELFATYDTYGAGTWILEAGDYYLAAGKNAHDALNHILAAQGYSMEDGMTETGNPELTWQWTAAETDMHTYSVSAQTGTEIHNQLEAADPNTFIGAGSNTIDYVSRNNWEGTMPSAVVTLMVTPDMLAALQSDHPVVSEGTSPTYGAASGMTLAMLYGKTMDDPQWDALLNQLSFDEINTLLTSCISVTPGITSIAKPQTKEMDGPTYCKESPNGCHLPCEGIWASTFNLELIAKTGVALANDALYAGFQGMYAPGINIHRTPYGGRAHEYFSEDPVLTGLAAEAEIQAMQKYGVIAFVKHYAFNDQEANRNGVGIWLNEQAAREIYLRPWRYAVAPSRGNAHAVMSSFNRMGNIWTSASTGLITNILRGEFGFDGFVLTDMADSNGSVYMSCLDGIVAGTDAWLSSGKDHSFASYKGNATVENAMRSAAHRILYTIVNHSAIMEGYSAATRVERISTWWETALQVALWGTAALSAVLTVLYFLNKRKTAKTA